jgi:hypothetical protein
MPKCSKDGERFPQHYRRQKGKKMPNTSEKRKTAEETLAEAQGEVEEARAAFDQAARRVEDAQRAEQLALAAVSAAARAS